MADLIVSVDPLDGSTTTLNPHIRLPLVVKVENHGGSTVNLLGVQFTCADSRLKLPTFGVVPSGAVGQGNEILDNACWVINAGETGSYRGDVVCNTEIGVLGGSFTFDVNAFVQPNEGQGALVSGSNSGSYVTASSALTLTYEAPQPEGLQNLGPAIVWSRFDNRRNPLTNYDFSANTVINQLDGYAFQNGVLPPQLDLPGTSWSSTNTAVATVIPTGSYSAASSSVSGGYLVGGGGAVSVVGTGTTFIRNNIAAGVTSSLTLKVVEALPVDLRVIPSLQSTNPNTIVALPTMQFQSQVKYTDSDWTDVTSGASTTWSSSNTKVFTVSSAGVVTQVAGAIAGNQAVITCTYNNTSTGRPAFLRASAVAVVGKSS